MVNINKLKLTILQQEILSVLFKNYGKLLNQRQISKMVGVSQPAVMKALPLLEKENMLKVEKDSETKRWSVEINSDNEFVIQLKRVDNLKQIYYSGLFSFLEQKFIGATIILFGSYSRGEDTIYSDMDIAIIGKKEKQLNLASYEKIFGKEIRTNFYPSFKDIHKHLRDNILNGIILSGSVEL